LDLVFVNEGREPCVLFAAPNALGSRFPVEIVFPAARQAVGSSIAVYDLAAAAGSSPLRRFETGVVQGRGCQAVDRARLGLANGNYRLEVRYSSGEVHAEEFEVSGSQLFLEVKP
ncbi:MAG: hypothetical protein VCD34_06170, partial [Planctomycetota bacterium]